MYVFGGEFADASGDNFRHFGDLWRMNLTTNEWEEVRQDKRREKRKEKREKRKEKREKRKEKREKGKGKREKGKGKREKEKEKERE